MKELNKSYNIPQEILYTVCLTAWNLCSSNLQKFAGLKAYYTEAFIADAVEAVKAAKQLTGSRQTLSNRQLARINLMSAARPVMDNWQLLKRYIYKASDKNMIEIKLQVAGDCFYKKASLYNWNALQSLIDTGNIFIANNLEELMANGNMPAGFQTTFMAAGESFMALSESFFHIKIDKQRITQEKIDANNAIYAGVIEMLKDGQQIFRNDSIIKKQFFFKYLVSMQRGEGSASLKGRIVNNLNIPVEGALIVSRDQKYTATTDSKGNYHINRIAAGTHTFTITCPGYTPLEQIITFAAATASKGDFELTSAMKKVA